LIKVPSMHAPAAFNQNLAVVIGINRYGHGIAQLRTATKDAQALAQILKSEHGYDTYLLLDEAATRQGLLQLLHDRLLQLVTPDDRVLFYFAGHGVAIDGDDGPAGYLVPQDAKPGDDGTFLPMQMLHDALTALPCRHSLIILDCCFSGAFRWSSTRDIAAHPEVIYKERFDRFLRSPAWQVITSAAYDQTAFDILQDHRGRGHTGDHSPFAEALFDALRGQADRFPIAHNGQPGGDGVITATELYLYLRDRVELATEAINQCQTPGLWPLRKHDKGEYIFLVPGHELNLPPAPELNTANNPYRGLASFDEAQAHLYFGRSQLVEELQSFVQEHPLTVVLGPSGTGKSSLVKAGLIPVLRQSVDSDWEILPPIRPGDAPLKALAGAILSLELAREALTRAVDDAAEELANDPRELTRRVLAWGDRYPHKRLLLVVDQFEELITQCRSEQERQQFLDLLHKALRLGKKRGRIVLTLRSDFEPQFQSWLAETWMQSRFLVKPMTQDELRQAIEAPAAERVMVFEPYSLVDQLINEVVQMPGALPLLSFTLSELYLKYLQRQDSDRTLTQSDYEALGGVAGSLTQRATQEYETLQQQDPAYEHTMKRVMLRMVAIEGGELARRRVPRSELVYPDEAENARVEIVIQRLIAARLVVKGQDPGGEPYVEPAHDALVQGWNQLQRWKNEEQENLSLQRLLTPAANSWQLNQQNVRDLWANNSRLERLLEIDRSTQSWLNQLETTFVRLSRNRRRNNRRWRFGLSAGALAGLSALSIATTIYAGIAQDNAAEALKQEELALDAATRADNEAEKARQEADRALKSERLAEQRQQEAEEQRDLAQQREQEAQVARNAEAEQRSIAEEQRDIATQQRGIAEEQRDIAEDNQRKAEERRIEAEKNNAIALAKTASALFDSHQQLEALVMAIRAGKQLQTADWQNSEAALEVRLTLQKVLYGMREVNRIGPHKAMTSIAFSPDGKLIASLGLVEGNINIWELNGRLVQTLPAGHEGGFSLAFSADGNTLISAGGNVLKLWSKDETFSLLKEIKASSSFAHVIFSKIEDWAVAAGPSGQVSFITAEGSMRQFRAHSAQTNTVDLSPDEQLIVTVNNNDTVQIWQRATLTSITEINSPTTLGAFFIDQQTVALTKENGSVELRSISGERVEPPAPMHHDGAVAHLAVAPIRDLFFTASSDGVIKAWNLGGSLQYLIEALTGLNSELAFSAQAQLLASSGEDDYIRLWHPQGIEPVVVEGYSFALNPQDGSLVIGNHLGGITTCQAANYQWACAIAEIESQQGHKGGTTVLALSPNGELIATAGPDRKVKLWSATGSYLADLTNIPAHIMDLSFDQQGTTLAIAGNNDTVTIFDFQQQQKKTIEGLDGIRRIEFAPANNTLVTVGANSDVKFWSHSGELLSHFRTQHGGIIDVDFNQEGTLLATAGTDRTVSFWHSDGSAIVTTEPHGDDIDSIRFSDNQTLTTSTVDGHTYVWTLDGRLLQQFASHRQSSTAGAFIANGDYFVSAGRDGATYQASSRRVVIYPLMLDQLMQSACGWGDRYFAHRVSDVGAYCEQV